jgi:hypothetical protein
MLYAYFWVIHWHLVVYLPPHRTHCTKILPACNNAYQAISNNRQWLYTPNQELFLCIANANEGQWTTIHACPQRNHNLTGHVIQHRWITHRRTLLGHQPDTASSTVNLRYAHAAHTATSTHHIGRPLQPNTQVQPSHALINTDSKATQRFSRYHYHIQLGHFTALI